VEEARAESIKRDKAATEKALADAVERGAAELAAQKEFHHAALAQAKEALQQAEARADVEARADGERKVKEAGERERVLLLSVEELRQALTRAEQQAAFRGAAAAQGSGGHGDALPGEGGVPGVPLEAPLGGNQAAPHLRGFWQHFSWGECSNTLLVGCCQEVALQEAAAPASVSSCPLGTGGVCVGVQAAEARHEELVARMPDSTRPLLRQIEAMQESSNMRVEALAGVERTLNARLSVRFSARPNCPRGTVLSVTV